MFVPLLCGQRIPTSPCSAVGFDALLEIKASASDAMNPGVTHTLCRSIGGEDTPMTPNRCPPPPCNFVNFVGPNAMAPAHNALWEA